jgi:hypothetical protein
MRNAGCGHDRVGSAIGYGVEGAHPLGDLVAGFAGEFDKLIQLQVQITKVGPDHVPMGLLSQQVQLDEVD